MPFPSHERTAMLELKFVGHTVVDRLEQLGFSSLAQLRDREALENTLEISKLIGSTCWHNSPQARAAVRGIVDLASKTSS